ncbi:hypothetical protein B0H19DRAFT_937538 [Mycena capillaripes]|nr:hypothetical protein B0H19DRAFT_937538 [Mycena capillaripes]
MRLSPLLLALALFYRDVRAGQIPLQTAANNTTILPSYSLWADLDAHPDAHSTGHLIFDTVNSLSQHWPNTRYRNGHNIIPGTVPVGTLLYHGRGDKNLPTVPDWTATDPEHAFQFCSDGLGNASVTGCWQLTLVTTRPLKVLYFDGSSGANMRGDGTLDAQDLLIWGKVDPARWRDDWARLHDLCTWGRKFGLDGYVRMEMDFEVMLCDFSIGVELLSADYLAAWTSRHLTPGPDLPYSPRDKIPSAIDILQFEVIRAGGWHNHYPGESRIVLDMTRFISFYDISLAPSLVSHREGQERWDHRLQNISAADLVAVNTRLEQVLSPEISESGSGIDWKTQYRVLVDRYADRLELLEYLLNTTTPDNLDERARLIQTQLRIILTPYILSSARPVRPISASAHITDNAWARPVWHGCATKHTGHIHGSAALSLKLTASERLLLRALDETNREICRVVVRMWAAGVHAGLDPLLPREADNTPSENQLVLDAWRMNLSVLMRWLDWGVWVKCRPACGSEEMCYLPTWPFFWDKIDDSDRKDGLWKRPQPRCIRQFEPYSPL